MPGIRLDFRGEVWQRHPLLVGQANPRLAYNIWRRSAALEPLRAGAKASLIPSQDYSQVRSFHLHEDQLVVPDELIDMASSRVLGDRARRLYYIKSGLLLYLAEHEVPSTVPTSLNSGHLVGVDAPLQTGAGLPRDRPTLSRNDFGSPPTQAQLDLMVETSIVFTMVNRFGEEGPPSLPSDVLKVTPGSTLNIGTLTNTPLTDPDIVGIRVYMLVEGGFFRISEPDLTSALISNGDRDYAGGVPNLSALVNPSAPQTNINFIKYAPLDVSDALVSAEWDRPPTGLVAMAAMDNGALAVADERNVYVSEQGYWHAWPVANRWPVDGLVRRIARIDGGLAILTDRDVQFLVGDQPAAMQMVTRRYPHSIADPGSLIEIDGGAAYVTHDGLAVVSLSGGEIVTDGWIDREIWRARVTPSECRLGLYDGRILIATRHPDGSGPIGYALNLAAQEITRFAVSESTLASGFFRDPRDNTVGHVIDSSGLGAFNEGVALSGVWESGDIVTGSMALSAYRVDSESYDDVQVGIRPEGLDETVYEPDNARPKRMASTCRAEHVRVRVSTKVAVASTTVATDLRSART